MVASSSGWTGTRLLGEYPNCMWIATCPNHCKYSKGLVLADLFLLNNMPIYNYGIKKGVGGGGESEVDK